ncbi:hypothetical protein SAMN05216289_106146 [Dokdonella immobilis]|uniref:Uncharacterized protein n=1 Tax=Dokdonella immobilis TaxID=578942 RepID=A0A1I4WY41_9GAMM|nr:hypothetical protein SAMN05216289_106146 [Dokdonella immobilis]
MAKAGNRNREMLREGYARTTGRTIGTDRGDEMPVSAHRNDCAEAANDKCGETPPLGHR